MLHVIIKRIIIFHALNIDEKKYYEIKKNLIKNIADKIFEYILKKFLVKNFYRNLKKKQKLS